MLEEDIKWAKEKETIELKVMGRKLNLICGFVGGVEANKDKDQVGAYLGAPNDELGMFYSLNSIIRSAIKAKRGIGESDADIKAFLATVFEQALIKEFKEKRGEQH